MANNPGKGGDQGGSANVDQTGQQGGHGSAGGMPDTQKGGQASGQRPEDKMNKQWSQSQDTGRQGGRPEERPGDKEKQSDPGRTGGQPLDEDQGMDKER
ncbi:hypothetical protein P5705_01730 [Pseudomonas entomophila]|uniref:hypothetical protein n=1 Tax=Pseudomonas entomophila TaxID=312306 RepID=UPI002406E34A|nr:hypothetical protein [Pseudomonas entomophila]MDF9616351.1 hypothetical protein [Pseudomonas entomophila]